MAQRLADVYRVPLILITLGEEGCYVHTEGWKERVPCPRVTAIDTSGAGDCFNSTLAVSLSAGLSLREAVRLALQAASYSVTQPDSWPAYPTFEQAAAFRGT